MDVRAPFKINVGMDVPCVRCDGAGYLKHKGYDYGHPFPRLCSTCKGRGTQKVQP